MKEAYNEDMYDNFLEDVRTINAYARIIIRYLDAKKTQSLNKLIDEIISIVKEINAEFKISEQVSTKSKTSYSDRNRVKTMISLKRCNQYD